MKSLSQKELNKLLTEREKPTRILYPVDFISSPFTVKVFHQGRNIRILT